MTAPEFDDRCMRGSAPGGGDPEMEARGKRDRFATLARRALVASLFAILTVLSAQPSGAAAPEPVKIAIFDFELNDKSAAGGIIAQDAIDTENLKQSTEQARSMFSASGRYSMVDTASAAGDVASAGGVQHCDGCDAPLAQGLGADQSMVGVVTRVSRAEYTVQIVVRDARTGAVVSNNFSGLRMGANYSWPRGVKSLLRSVLSAPPAQ